MEGEPVAKKTKFVLKTIIYDKLKANQWLDEPPLEIWDHHIIPLLSLKDLALARPVCTFFEAYWQEKFSNNVLPLRVGNDVATIDGVMGVIEILSSRRVYTKLNPFVVLLGKGDHEIKSLYEDHYGNTPGYYQATFGITRSNITFVGKGIDTTRILGGFHIGNVENITFKQMTLTNRSGEGNGIRMRISKVELMDVALKGCTNHGLYIPHSISETTVVATRCEFANSGFGAVVEGSLNSATFNNCVFYDNKYHGLAGSSKATIHLHGEDTAIHSNKSNGIYASISAKVIIHLPSNHNTCYNNGTDRNTRSFGTINNVED